MRGLVITLYIAVFLAIFGLDYGINRYYNALLSQAPATPYPGYQASLRLLAQQLAPQLNDPNQAAKRLQQHASALALPLSLDALNAIALPPELAEQRDRGEVIALESSSGVSLYLRINQSDWLLGMEVAEPATSEFTATRYQLTVLFYAGIAAILLLWITPLLRGVQQLNRAATHIGQGKLETRVVNPDGLFLRPLKQAFNGMAAKLQRQNENNQLLTQAVSHELRTPLSRMRFALDLLETRNNAAQRQKDIQRIEHDLDEMESLITELLNYARLDKAPQLNYQNAAIEPLISERIALRFDHKLRIEFVSSHPDQHIRVDPDQFCKVVDNLVQNACQHARSKVTISCFWSKSQLTLLVEDDGPGISEDQRKAIFKPFVQSNEQQGPSKKGFGLGLAIVARIVDWHGGSIVVDQSPGLHGARFEVSWPRSPRL